MIDWRKKFPKPHPEAMWCDECMRWETGTGGRFSRPTIAFGARFFEGLSDAVMFFPLRISSVLHDQAERCQVRANIRNGVFDARIPDEPRRDRSGHSAPEIANFEERSK